MILKLSSQDWFHYILTFCTILIISIYAYAHFIAETKYGQKYIVLLSTTRTLVLAGFLMYFYNPLRSQFDYGRSLPFFAFSAGVTMVLLLDKFQILNLVHFILYGDILPEKPQKICKLVENDAHI